MSYSLDLTSHGRQLKQLYDSIVSSDPSVAWAVFNYESQSNTLKPGNHGGNEGNFLADFVEEFDDGKIQYGFARVLYQNLPKFVLVGWVGEGVPERTKGYFNAHYSTVAKYFHGYHVQITARDSSGLSPSIILAKIDAAVGSKYGGSGAKAIPLKPKYSDAHSGAAEDDWGDAPQVVQKEELNPIQTAYRPTVVDMAALRNKPRAETPPVKHEPVKKPVGNFSDPKSSYQPIGKVDIAALRAQGKDSPFANTRSEPLQSSYKPIGKVDIAAIKAQAAKSEQYRGSPSGSAGSFKSSQPQASPVASKEPEGDTEEHPKSFQQRMATFSGGSPSQKPISSGNDEEDESPKSVKDRMNLFQGSGRLSQLPKPKVDNKVGARFTPSGGRGTAPSVPKSMFGESKAMAGFKDFGSEGGKTPAQLWAEKHGKTVTVDSPLPPQTSNGNSSSHSFTRDDLVRMEEQDLDHDEEVAEEREDFKDVRQQFENVAVDEDKPAVKSFADITSRFATPPKSEESTPPPPMPARNIPQDSGNAAPPLPGRNQESVDQSGRGIPTFHDEAKVVSEPPENTEGVPPSHVPVDIGKQEVFDSAIQEGGPTESTPELPGHGQPVKGFTAVASFDYDKDEDNEINLREGEVVTEIEKLDPDWWQGKNSQGEVGLFPSNYVELTDLAPGEEPHVVEVEEARQRTVPTTGPSAKAEYDYTAQEEGELSFPEGAIITDIEFVDEAWWSGSYNGETALFPANYVELID